MAVEKKLLNVLDETGLKKLEELNNLHAVAIVENYVTLLKPDKVTVIEDIVDNKKSEGVLLN